MAHARSQIGVWNVLGSGDFPWINYLKGAQGWDDNGPNIPDPTLLSTNGYPNGASSPALRTLFQIETLAEYSGNWVLRWTGGMPFPGATFSAGYSNVNGVPYGTNGRCEFQLTATDSPVRNTLFTIQAAGNLTEVAIMRLDEETRFLAGEIFNTKFLSRLTESGAGCIRFLDWTNVNNSMESTWATRKPLNYAIYGSSELRPSIHAGTLVKSGADYTTTATPSGWTGLVDKATVTFYVPSGGATPVPLITAAGAGASGKVRLTLRVTDGDAGTTGFTTGNSVRIAYSSLSGIFNCTVINGTQLDLDGSNWVALGSPTNPGGYLSLRTTLSVAGSTPKFMDLQSGRPVYDPGHSLTAGLFGMAMYDAAMDCWCRFGGAIGYGVHQGLVNGVPPELMIALCNKVNMHPWFNIPTHALDPIGDYTTSLATLCRDTLNPGLVPRFECMNEIWGGQFFGYYTGVYKGKALWGLTVPMNNEADGDVHNWYGKVVSTAGQAISAVYSADRSKYKMMCGFQTHNTFIFEASNRLDSERYVTVNGGSAAKNWATHICLANYFNSSYYLTAGEITLANEWLAGDATVKAARINTYLLGCRDTSWPADAYPYPRTVAQVVRFQTDWPAYAGKIMFYEGGYSPDYSGDHGTVDLFRAASKYGPELVALTAENYAAMLANGGSEPSHYMLSGAQAWAIWDPDIYVSPDPPIWTAIKAFNATADDPPATPTTSRIRIKTR